MPDPVLAISIPDGVIAAAIAAGVSLATLFVAGRRAERTHRRELFARAYSAVVAYQEFPYAIRRRRPDIPGEERVRLSEALRTVQEELAFHMAWIALEASKETADRYRTLVAETRRVAGGYMHDAWEFPGASEDAAMNITDIDYSGLEGPQDRFLESVRTDLRGWSSIWPTSS